jgi:3-deoxy-D-manno-octulosonate 8-phosphate phosphatase (KDO 8-P phosphatase)
MTPWSAILQAGEATGGQFVRPPEALAARLESIQGLVFDWDGVFNDGRKGPGHASTFSEPDSMGLNMLRYGLWRRGHHLAPVAVISGADNPAAIQFAQRERLQTVYLGVRDKHLALGHFCQAHGIRLEDAACTFDDINDLAMAQGCGLRCLVGRVASPFLQGHVVQAGLADYITGCAGGAYAVREVTEMLLVLMGAFEATLASRVALDEEYRSYFQMRQRVVPAFYTQDNAHIAPLPVEHSI